MFFIKRDFPPYVKVFMITVNFLQSERIDIRFIDVNGLCLTFNLMLAIKYNAITNISVKKLY
jgi:hypothetical protein